MAGSKKRTVRPGWQVLSWHAARNQWKKYRAGRTYYLGESGVTRSRASHDSALREWLTIESDLRARADPSDPRSATDSVERALAEQLGRRLPDAMPIDYVIAMSDRDVDQAVADESSTTIGGTIEEYLAAFRAQVKVGNRSHGRYEPLRIHLKKFREWAPPSSPIVTGQLPIDAVSSALLTAWHTHLINQIAEDRISAQYAHDLLGSVKQWVRWSWEQELCGLPRNFNSKLLSIAIPPKTVRHFTADEIERLLNAATDRTKLLILLALNIGGTAKDLSDLSRDEVDLRAGAVTRRRSKTGHHAGVPTVTYRLWPETLRLLKKHRSQSEPRVLLTDKGNPLVHEEMRGEKSVKSDSVRLAFNRAKSAANKQAADNQRKITRTFKTLRATGANMIDHGPHKVADLYLAHSPRSVKDRHYTSADQEELDRALFWLGKQLRQAGFE